MEEEEKGGKRRRRERREKKQQQRRRQPHAQALGSVLKEPREATRGWAVERVLKTKARS